MTDGEMALGLSEGGQGATTPTGCLEQPDTQSGVSSLAERGPGIALAPPAEAELVAEWAAYAAFLAQSFFHPSLDADDWRQEALIATWTAVRTFDPSSGSFKPFLAMVVHRRLVSVLREAQREKRRGNVEALRSVVLEGELVDAAEAVEAPHADACELLETRDRVRAIVAGVSRLSPLERRAVVGILNGMTYQEIGEQKTVDNALQRARIKLRQAA